MVRRDRVPEFDSLVVCSRRRTPCLRMDEIIVGRGCNDRRSSFAASEEEQGWD